MPDPTAPPPVDYGIVVEPPTKERVPTVDSKPAVGVFSGAVTTLGLSLANRYTSYQPTLEEVGAFLIIIPGLMMWLVPPTILVKLNRGG